MHILINEIQNHTTGGSGVYHMEYDFKVADRLGISNAQVVFIFINNTLTLV